MCIRDRDSLESVAGRVLGIVLNRVQTKDGHHYGGYAYSASADVSSTRRERKRVEQT